jgi:hypothetical protein
MEISQLMVRLAELYGVAALLNASILKLSEIRTAFEHRRPFKIVRVPFAYCTMLIWTILILVEHRENHRK